MLECARMGLYDRIWTFTSVIRRCEIGKKSPRSVRKRTFELSWSTALCSCKTFTNECPGKWAQLQYWYANERRKNVSIWNVCIGAVSGASSWIQITLDCKELLFQGYETGMLIAVTPFVAKILEGAKSSIVFRPPNPWLMGLLSVFRALLWRGWPQDEYQIWSRNFVQKFGC